MKAAVLGSPVAHSLSPVLHGAAYTALGLRDWAYVAIDCDEARLPGLMDGLDRDWAGLSLTMPLKRAVLPLLDEIDQVAADVGGANTVILSDGRRRGYNTDVGGMVDALAAAGVTAGTLAGTRPLIIGAGATASAALAALRDLGLKEAEVAVRETTATDGLVGTARRLGVSVRLCDLPAPGVAGTQRSARCDPADGVASGSAHGGATPVTAHGLTVCTLPPGAADLLVPWLRERPMSSVVFDVAYVPWPTRLAAAARAAGSVVVGGFELLLHQAGRQVELMTGHLAPLEAMRRAGLAELAARAQQAQQA